MELIVYSSILAAIVLALVGLIKLPLIKFKGKKFYKAGLTILSMVITIAACVICQTLIICDTLLSLSFLYLLVLTIGEVALAYNKVYENLGLKELFNNLFDNIGKLMAKNPQNKLTKYAEKVGLDKAIILIAEYTEKKQAELNALTKPADEVKEV